MSTPTIPEIAQVASGIYLEGLAVDTLRKRVWYSDVVAGGIHALMPDGEVVSVDSDRMWTGGVMLNQDGSALSSGPGGIRWNNLETGKSGWLLDELPDEVVSGVNEMAPDGEGGLFFGTCDIEMVASGGTPRPTQIYRLTRDRELLKLADDIGFSNGIMYDAANHRFYCNDTFTCSWEFDVGADLTLANRRQLIDREDADGMALDAEGNVWITGFRSAVVTRVSPGGDVLAAVETPAEAITQVRFGGQDMRDIYINAVPIDGGDNLKDGEIPTEKRSVMYRGRSSVPGRPVEPTRFELD